MKKYILPILVLVIANILLFHKFFFEGLLPFPGDLLVSYYFPWHGGGFEGYDPWTTRKDVIAMDVVRQMYPWKTLVFDQIKSWQLPLWNPYNFSGTPLLANLQSSVFFPTGSLFLIIPYLPAWIAHVILLPLLLSIFSYLFLRSSNLSRIAALFGAIAISNLSYITVWAEQIVVIQSALFLPLILYLVNKRKFLFAAPLLACSFFGGHIQTTVYVYLIVIFYAIFKRTSIKSLALTLILSIGLSAVQLLPSAELYLNSARETLQSTQLFKISSFPWENLITMFAPDFYGNPATNNFKGIDYGNFQGYFGVVALVLSLLAAFNVRKNSNVLFFLLLGLAGLIFSLSPFTSLFQSLKIPVLSSGYPSRMIFIFQFSFAVLASIGLDFLLKDKSSWKKIFIALILVGLVYLISLFFIGSLRNLVLPVAIFLTVGALVLGGKFAGKKILFGLLVLALFEYSYFFSKYQPFAPLKFVFPPHQVFSSLDKRDSNYERFYGSGFSYIDNNFATYYRVYSPEGYDPLYIKRYGELLSAGKDIQRSDAFIPIENKEQQNRILDILGAKFILGITDATAEARRIIHNRSTALPRALLFDEYGVSNNPVEKIYAKQFNPSKTLLLEKAPPIEVASGTGSAEIVSYYPNKVIIKTNSTTNQLLFLSDNFYPGWRATVDGKEIEILRANHTFRAVPVVKGGHTVVFLYDPQSFKIGLIISLVSLLAWGILCLKKSSRS